MPFKFYDIHITQVVKVWARYFSASTYYKRV